MRSKGLLGFLRVAIRRFWRFVYLKRIAILLCRDLQEPISDIVPQIDIDIQKIGVDTIAKLKDIAFVDRKKYSEFENRLKNGREGFMVLVGERCVGYMWISFENEYEPLLSMTIEVNNESCYLYDSYVVPEFRGKGIHNTVASRVLRYGKSRGCKKGLSVIAIRNVPSMRTSKTMGLVDQRVLRTIRIFGIPFRSSTKIQDN